MKKLLSLLCFFMCLGYAHAQLNINVHGNVFGDNGVPQPGINVSIAILDSQGNGLYSTSAITDASGLYSTDISFPKPADYSKISVSIKDCNEILRRWIYRIKPSQPQYIANFNYCSSFSSECSTKIVRLGNKLITETKGKAPFVYHWSTGETTSGIVVKDTGKYCVTVIDNTGCISIACIEIKSLKDCDVSIVKDGDYLVAIPTGTGPFQYSWSNGSDDKSIKVTEPGKYCVRVVDANGCVAEACFEIPDGHKCSVTIVQHDNRLEAIPTGVAPYTYHWSTGSTDKNITVTEPGKYCVTVVDATGCVAEACFEIGPKCSVKIVQDGDYLVAIPTGSEPFKYTWSNGSTDKAIKVSEPGKYCVRVVDATGCVAEACFEIGPKCSVKIVQDGDYLVAIPTGSEPFKYTWNNGSNDKSIKVSEPGKYCVRVVDATGCVAEACFEIPDHKCSVSIVQHDNRLEALPTGVAPYTYHWSTGSDGKNITISEPGKYCVTIVDATGCVADTCIEIHEGTCRVSLRKDGHLLVADVTGSAPFTYHWTSGQTTRAIEPQVPGIYCVTITTSTGCTATACYTWGNDSCSVTITHDGHELTAHSNHGVFHYAWNTNDTTATIHITASGVYCVTIYTTTGCIADTCIEVSLLTGKDKGSLFGFPNPTSNNLNIDLDIQKDMVTTLYLYDAKGELKQTYNLILHKGHNTQEIITKDLHPGLYFIKLFDGRDILSSRFYKQ